MEMEQENKRNPHSVRINSALWKQAKASGLNVSKHIEESLKLVLTSKSREALKMFSHCKLCSEDKDIDRLLGVNYRLEDGFEVYILCDVCEDMIVKDELNCLLNDADIKKSSRELYKCFFKVVKEVHQSNSFIFPHGLRGILEVAQGDNYMFHEFKKGYYCSPTHKEMETLWGKETMDLLSENRRIREIQ